MESKSELACVYSALILADDDIDVTADKINALLKAANIKFVEPYFPGLFAGALNNVNIKDLLSKASSPGAGAPASAAAPVAAVADAPVAAAKEVPKEESEESEGDMGFDLFG